MHLLRPAILLLATSPASFAGDSKATISPPRDWAFSLSAGPAWRQSGSLGFSGGSRSPFAGIPSFVGENSLTIPPIGSDDAYSDRTYNDGFVFTDLSTDIDGLTANWGYQDSGQVDAASDSLYFHATGYQSIRTDTLTRSPLPSLDRNEKGIAPVLQFDATYQHEIGGILPGFSASLSWSPIRMNRSWRDFSLLQTRDDYRHDWTDIYNLGGYGSLVPSAPYTGGTQGPGFLLENIPDSSSFTTEQIGSENAVVANNVSTRFRADHTTLSFGPTLERRVSDQWKIEAGVGLSLHWLHWSAKQKERLSVSKDGTNTTVQAWSESSSGNTILAGVYLQVGTEWTPHDSEWSLKTLLRTDIGQSLSEQVGPSRITYDTDGFTAAVMLTHPL